MSLTRLSVLICALLLDGLYIVTRYRVDKFSNPFADSFHSHDRSDGPQEWVADERVLDPEEPEARVKHNQILLCCHSSKLNTVTLYPKLLLKTISNFMINNV